MPEQEHDRLEDFFRKATNRPDVAFNEEDWKKLEARLDAAGQAETAPVASSRKGFKAFVIAALLLSTVAVWIGSTTDMFHNNGQEKTSVRKENAVLPPAEDTQRRDDATQTETASEHAREQGFEDRNATTSKQDGQSVDVRETPKREMNAPDQNIPDKELVARIGPPVDHAVGNGASQIFKPLAHDKILRELIVLQPLVQRVKQEAVVELPGAEEADAPGAETMVKEEHASDKKEHVATPRLSLLLSFAPDFSATSLDRYSAPGKAFGAMIHYHAWTRWSFSAGIIKNTKQYTGDGEDYHPPAGYWKYYTNGIIPESIDGSCSILEFPVMVQYTISTSRKHRWLLGAGASSYLMQSESYRYRFEEPNPGAKEGWDSRSSSRFLFNMMNFTVGYEYQVVPGLMLGIEPYVKIPLEKIGWSNLKLYSTGASFTLRYTLISRKRAPLNVHSRSPD